MKRRPRKKRAPARKNMLRDSSKAEAFAFRDDGTLGRPTIEVLINPYTRQVLKVDIT